MADIARAAGVHKMTVSRVLNNKQYVAEPVRRKVLQIAEELGYRKNELLSSVLTQVARSQEVHCGAPILFIFDWPTARGAESDIFSRRLVAGGRERAELYGFGFDMLNPYVEQLSDQRLDSILEARGIQGVIINVAYRPPRQMNLNWDRLVAVTMGGRLPIAEDLPQVQSDITFYLDEVFAQLERRDYRRIGFAWYQQESEIFQNRAHGCILAHQSKLPPKRRVPTLFLGDAPADAFERWLDRYEPDVVVSRCKDHLDSITATGRKVPDDIGFVQIGLESPDAGISGTYHDKADISSTAVDVVVQRLISGRIGPGQGATRTLVPLTWIDAPTVRPAPSTKPN